MAGDTAGRHRVAVRRELQQEWDPDAVRVLCLVAQVLQVRGRVPCRDRKSRPLRCEMECHEAAEARAQETEAAVESRMTLEKGQHGARVFQTRADGRLVLAARRLTAATEVEPRARQPRARRFVAQQEVLVAVLAGAEAVERDDAGNGCGCVGKMENEGELGARQDDGVSFLGQTQTRSNNRQVFVESWNIASSTGSPFSLATSSATRLASQGPESVPSNSPPYFHGPSLSTSSASIGTSMTISRSRSRETTSAVTETKEPAATIAWGASAGALCQ